jgi:membrane protease YdiL (CAAX protease family)
VLIYIIIYLLGLPLPFNFHIPFLSIPFLFCLFFLGASAEETGYMGYAIDTIQERFSALSAGILIGAVLLAITAIAITWLWGTETLSKYRFLEQSASKGVA